MKKLYTLLFIGALYQSVSAQITITSSSNFAPGDSGVMQRLDATAILESAAGANVTANFATAATSGSPYTSLYVAPSQGVSSSSFPTATVAAYIMGQAASGYQYMKASASAIELLGVATSSYTMVYSNPQTIVSYPFSYNSTSTDAFSGSYTANGITVYRSGSSTTTADAHGTITTPNGTFTYLRFKIEQAITDSMILPSPSPAMVQTQAITTYNYMSTKRKGPVFGLSYITNSSGTTKSAYYDMSKDQLTTAIEEEATASMLNASVYPNPATSDDITVNFNLVQNEEVNVTLMDMNGKLAYNKTFDQVNAGQNQLNIGNQDLQQGIYFVRLSTPSGLNQTVKVLVK